jgi:hypothetical protein
LDNLQLPTPPRIQPAFIDGRPATIVPNVNDLNTVEVIDPQTGKVRRFVGSYSAEAIEQFFAGQKPNG